MLSYNGAFYELLNKLKGLYDDYESAAIAHEVMHHVTGRDKLQRILEKDTSFSAAEQTSFELMQAELLSGKPLQYVIGHAWFMGRRYKVNEHVLIPRPETEELVDWIVQDMKDVNKTISILDIGTGSGCIPISLKLELPKAIVSSCDVSSNAIAVAKKNAQELDADITVLETDFLDAEKRAALGLYDIIVSNPPYIPANEKEQLHKNVKDFEPSLALFVPNDDALLFYRTIAMFGKEHLNKEGCIYCELHVDYALATKQLFEDMGYSYVEIRKDMHGNLRMLKAK
ncbi:MAG: peptide chain release factor N(5)-glutamine methyltransferase [Bacteroidetes bacterium]|nr:peptide chain release factor N(5)-glutamine methyltransferase [Bacteroidota bacterium]